MMSTIPIRKRRPRSEDQVDEAIEESFPASDPPSYSRTAGTGAPPRGAKLDRVPRAEAEAEHGSEGDKDGEKDGEKQT